MQMNFKAKTNKQTVSFLSSMQVWPNELEIYKGLIKLTAQCKVHPSLKLHCINITGNLDNGRPTPYIPY